MSENLVKILKFEDQLADLFENGIDTTNTKGEEIVLEISKLLKKASNDDLLYLLLNCNYIHKVIDVTTYFKKYKINKKNLASEKNYKETFEKLSLFVERIHEASVCESEYLFICSKCDVDNIASFLLKNMSNEDIMSLSNASDDWNYKLFLFENLKA